METRDELVYSTGQPFTEPGSGYITAPAPGAPYRYVEYAPTRINNVRFPPYARLDVSLTYEREFQSWSMAPYVQLFNTGNRKNVWFVMWFYGRYEIIVYASDDNYEDFMQTYNEVQEEDGNFHEPVFDIQGDGIGVFGAVVPDTVYVDVLR